VNGCYFHQTARTQPDYTRGDIGTYNTERAAAGVPDSDCK